MVHRNLKSAAALMIACGALIVGAPAAYANGRAQTSKHTVPLGGMNLGGIYSGMSLSGIDSEIALAHKLHAKLVRVEMPWSQFEPLGRGHIDPGSMAAADRLVKDAAAAHIRVIALVDNTPCWASSAPSALIRTCVPDQHSKAKAYPPRKASDYGAFVGWLAKRYGKQLAAIEVWNEPDQINQEYLRGNNKPGEYAKLLRAAYPAIKRANRHVKVLAGSLVGSNGAFMKALYRAGIKGYYDGVAVHFYTLVLGSVRAFHEVQLEHHDHKPLWLDEFGWSSCWPQHKIQEEQGCVTQRTQAQNITNAFHELARAKYVAAQLTYGLRDIPTEEFGVLTTSGKRKPSFRALAGVLRNPFGKPSPIRLKLRRKHGYVVASGSGPVGDYMRLEAFEGGRLRYHAIFTLNRFNRYSIKLPKVLGTHGLTVRVWQYWQGRKHGAQGHV